MLKWKFLLILYVLIVTLFPVKFLLQDPFDNNV